MNILGIETSCDETSVAIIKGDFEILSNVVLSQDEIHAVYGGVVPELASRQHLVSIGYVFEECLSRAKVKLEQVDVYAVTQGPGLIGSLLVGLSFAKGLAYYFQKPLFGIDHLEAHIEAAFLENSEIPFPGLALVVSGGHTSSFLMREKLSFELLGRTRDDAAGEALDKIAKFLDLGYPGGPAIDLLARKGSSRGFSFSLPRMSDKSLDFSFSGLKTAALRQIKEHGISKNHPQFFDFLAGFEMAVFEALIQNMAQAVEKFRPKSLILCGGVARNKKLRERFAELARECGLPSFIPSPEFCTDNAAMVASLALEKVKKGEKPSSPFELNAYPRFASLQPFSKRAS